jgi:uncharacterized protein
VDGSGRKPWRKVCEEALRAHSEPDAIRFWRVAHETNGTPHPIFDYRFEHTLAAVKIARWLAPQVGADPDVVECAAWLHDCTKHYHEQREHDTHAREASALVPGILAGSDFPPGKIPAVQHAIEHHVGLKLSHRLEPLETACLWDADKLSKIGAASLVHYGCISGAFQPINTARILERGEQWLVLARGIVSSMNTEPARREAERRLVFLENHYAQLRREWSEPMEDLCR